MYPRPNINISPTTFNQASSDGLGHRRTLRSLATQLKQVAAITRQQDLKQALIMTALKHMASPQLTEEDHRLIKAMILDTSPSGLAHNNRLFRQEHYPRGAIIARIALIHARLDPDIIMTELAQLNHALKRIGFSELCIPTNHAGATHKYLANYHRHQSDTQAVAHFIGGGQHYNYSAIHETAREAFNAQQPPIMHKASTMLQNNWRNRSAKSRLSYLKLQQLARQNHFPRVVDLKNHPAFTSLIISHQEQLINQLFSLESQITQALEDLNYSHVVQLVSTHKNTISPKYLARLCAQGFQSAENPKMVQLTLALCEVQSHAKLCDFILASHNIKPTKLKNFMQLLCATDYTLGRQLLAQLLTRPEITNNKVLQRQLIQLEIPPLVIDDFENSADAIERCATRYTVSPAHLSVIDSHFYIESNRITNTALNNLLFKQSKIDLAGSYFNSIINQTLKDRSITNTVINEVTFSDLSRADFSDSHIKGSLHRVKLEATNFSGSLIELNIGRSPQYQLRLVDFGSANLSDVDIILDYQQLSAELTEFRNLDVDDQINHADPRILVREIFDYLQQEVYNYGGPLAVINSIPNQFVEIKQKLLLGALKFLQQHDLIQSLTEPLLDVLSKNSCYLEDPQIRQLLEQEGLLSKILNHFEKNVFIDIPKMISYILSYLKSLSAEQQQHFMFNYPSVINQLITFQRVAPASAYSAQIQLIAANFYQIPSVSACLDQLKVVHGEENFENNCYAIFLCRDGTALACEQQAFEQFLVADHDFNAERVMAFEPIGEHLQLSIIPMARYKSQLTSWLSKIGLLMDAYQRTLPTPTVCSLEYFFNKESSAYNRLLGYAKGADDDLLPEFALEQIMPALQTKVVNYANITNKAQWSQSELTPATLASIHSEMIKRGIDESSENYAQYLFGLSAFYTRLSSEAYAGSSQSSVTELRFLGYLLFKSAIKIQPQLLSNHSLSNLEDRFLGQNNAMDCSEILSKRQYQHLRALNPAIYQQLTPETWLSVGDGEVI